jgi:hypothetical protein
MLREDRSASGSWDAERPGLHSHAERGNDQMPLNIRY